MTHPSRRLRRTSFRRPVLFGFLVLMQIFGAVSVSAYHFFYIQNGSSYLIARWTTSSVPVVVDNGPTDFLASAQTAINTWNNVSTAKDVFGTVTRASGDFTAANFETAWGIMGDGKVEIVIDEDGSIIKQILKADTGILNGKAIFLKEVVGAQGVISDGYVVVNFSRSNFDRLSTLIHELGHLQGLAHSSVGMHNSGTFATEALDRINLSSVPTMHPFSVGTSTIRQTLEPDDIAAISELYPEPTFSTSFASIEGTVTECGSTEGITGANVRAVNISNPNIQLTRFTGYDGNESGRFRINGLPPGSYRLLIEPMGANNLTISNNFGEPPVRQEIKFQTEYYNPPDEDSCTEELPDTAVNIPVSAGGIATDKNFKAGGADLAFVVDDTGSMDNEIGGVRDSLSNFISITDTLNRTLRIPFPTVAIVTFKDNVTKRLVSKDPVRLQAVVDGLFASGGGDCPESSNAALLTAGRLLKQGGILPGVAMLFTDADSRPDGPDRAAVTDLYRAKGARVFTLLSGSCSGGVSSLTTSSSGSSHKFGQRMFSPGGSLNDEFPLPPTLGFETSVRTLSQISVETGGFFTAIPGIKTGDPIERQKYINTGTNLAVSAAAPAVGLVTPANGPQGSTFNIQVNGSNTNFNSSSVLSFSGSGITLNSATVNSPVSITASISIASGAAQGFRDVVVTTNLGGNTNEAATGVGAFNITSPSVDPTVLGVSPIQGAQGQTLDVLISGQNTHFVNGSSSATFGSGVTVNSLSVLSSVSARANITINSAATIGFRDVQVTTGSEFATENGVGPFLVTAPPLAIARVTLLSPAEGQRGQTLNVAVTGVNSNFENGVSRASFTGDGILVNNTTVTSPTTAVANITIGANATLGFRDLSITTGSQTAVILNGFRVTPAPDPLLVQFSAAAYNAGEGAGSMLVTVTRSGDTSASATVKVATADTAGLNACTLVNGAASERCDYGSTIFTLRFAAGETSKNFLIPLVDDAHVEGNESFTLVLSNPTGASLGTQSTVTATILDNDSGTPTQNPIDGVGAFITQQYIDFLGRLPDPIGLANWTATLGGCPNSGFGEFENPNCDRVHVSAGFFLSDEFRGRSYFAYKFYEVGFDRRPAYAEFVPDVAEVGGPQSPQSEVISKAAYTDAFVQRPEFKNRYDALSNSAYVDALETNAEVTLTNKAALVAALDGNQKTRAQVLREIVELQSVTDKFFIRAFVAMQYFGYLRRDPDTIGFNNWVTTLTNNPADFRHMIFGFIYSTEYRSRFGP
jgi:hypothetical protein